MLFMKANWLLDSGVGQTGQWSVSRNLQMEFSFCQTDQIIICARDSKMNGEEISKIQIEQYQKPSFYILPC